jgi:hypothetical protein
MRQGGMGVILTMKEVNRLRVLQVYMAGKVGIEEASRILKRRARSACRMVANLRKNGPQGLFRIHTSGAKQAS